MNKAHYKRAPGLQVDDLQLQRRVGSWTSDNNCARPLRPGMTRLHKFLFISSLMAVSPLLYAAGPAGLPGHPLVGTWTWTLFGGSCTETFQYRQNNVMLGTSGQEVVEKTYAVSALPDGQGFYRLVETVLRQNDKKDCSGTLLDGPGDETTRFVQFSPARDKLLMCQSASLAACFGPLKRSD